MENQLQPSIMRFNTHVQYTFSKLWEGYESNDAAKLARDEFAKQLKAQGYKNVRKSILRNQLKKYDGFGISNSGICHVYQITRDYKSDE